MKKIIQLALIAVVISITTIPTFAQKSFTEGKILYAITYPDMELNSEMEAMMPKESTVFIKGIMSRTELNMGMGINTASIMNSKTGEIIGLTDMMGSKSAMKMTPDDMQKARETNKTPEPKIKLTDETKEIAGFECKRALVKSTDDTYLDIYYTDKINVKTPSMVDWKDIKGFPLEYSLNQNGLKMKFTAKSVVSEKVSDDMFEIPTDYKLLTQDEMMKMMEGVK